MRKIIFIDSQRQRFETEIHKFMQTLNQRYLSNLGDIVFELFPKEEIKVKEFIHPKELGRIVIFETTKVEYAPGHNIFSLMWAKCFYELGYSVYLLDILYKKASNFQGLIKKINPNLILDNHNVVANQSQLIATQKIPPVNFLELGCPVVLLVGELPLWQEGSLISLETLQFIKKHNHLFYIFCHDKSWCLFFERFGIKNVDFLLHYTPYEFSYPTEYLAKTYPISFVGNFFAPSPNHLPKGILTLINNSLQFKKNDLGYKCVTNLIEKILQNGGLRSWHHLAYACNQIGYQYESIRYFVISELIKKYKLTLFGKLVPSDLANHPNIDYKGPAHWLMLPIIFGMTAINLNIHRVVFDTGTQERSFMLIFSKAFFLTDYKEIFSELFPETYKKFTFRTVKELKEKIAYYLKHDNERREISENLYQKAISKYTMRHRAQEILNLLGLRYL